MRYVIRGAFLFMAITLVVIICMDMGSSAVRDTETAEMANNSTYNAIRVMANGTYDVDSMDDLVAEAIKEIVLSKETNSDIKVQVLGVDAENGMIDLNIIQTINHANGKVTKSEERRTVILENNFVDRGNDEYK